MKNNELSPEKKSIQQSFSADMYNIIQPPTPWCSTVKWGAHHLFDIKLSNSIIYSCFPLTDYYTNIGSNTSIQGRVNDFVAITSNSIIRFDGETRAIKDISKSAYCAGVYIPIHDVIVAVSATTSHFNFIRPEDMKHPIESEFRSMQFPCFHINFLKKSHILITSGNDIRIWNLKCVLPSRNIITIKPQINITLRATIEIGFEFNYLNPPCIDYLNELIILPKGSGFLAYDINGQLIKEMTKLPTSSQTLVSFLPNEELETDQNKNKKMSNQKSSQKLYYQPNAYSKKSQFNNSQDEKKDSNQDDNSVLVTADSEYGVCEWTPNGTLKKRHTSGNSNIIALRLINKSFFLYIDIKNKIYIVDMLARTPRMFLVATSSEKPLSMVLFRTNSVSSALQFGLALCINTTISIYQIVVPWKLFAPSIIKPTLIKLCPRRNRAARIQVQTSNSDLYLLSPKTSQPITSAAPNNPKKIIDTLYDRGLLAKEVRDQLIIVVENGEIVCFSTANIPCEIITTIDDHAAAVFLAYANKSIFSNSVDNFTENETDNNLNEKENDNDTNSNSDIDQNSEKELCYCVVTQNGEIFLCDYNSFKCKKRYIIQTGIVKTAKYDMTYGTVIMSYLNMLLRFDIQNGVILEKLKQIPSGVVTCLEKGILLIGYESGKIIMIKIREKKMEIMKSDGVSYHTSAVTGFSFGSNFFLSSSIDQTIKIWSLKGETIGAISLPLPLYGIEIFNGKRDILVGTDKEIMVIEGRSIFMDEFEKKDDILDNYNEKDDELSNDAISPLQKQEEEKQAFLVARKAEEQEIENKNRKKEEEAKNNFTSNVVYLNSQNKRNNNNYDNTEKTTTQKKEIDEETRKRIIEQMTKITSNSTLSTRIAARERMLLEQKTLQIENEYKQEKELRRLQGEASLEEQELALKRRKEETILRRKREQEEKERKIKEQKEKEERERREKKEREERERREREEQERKEREERERKEREEQERREREERERLEREEQERLEREEQERLEREEQERLEQEERERLEREEQERLEREEQERIEREEKERIEREEKERLEREEQERKEKEEKERLEKEKEIQNQKIIYPPDDDPSFQAPRKKQAQPKEENQDKKEKKKKESPPKEKKKKKKSKSPSPPQKSSKNQQKEKNDDTKDEEKSEPLANVITFPNVLIEEKTEPQPTSNPQDKSTKSKAKTAQPKDLKNDTSDNNTNKKDKNTEDDSNNDDITKNLPFKVELAKWISSDGKVYTQSKKGDWSDDQQRLFQRQKNGSFTTTDSVIWRGPTIQKGRFAAAKGNRNFDVVGQRFVYLGNNRIYTNLGESKFSDSDGNIYTKGKDGKYFTDDKKKSWCGPDGNGFFEKMVKPKQIVGSDGKNYKLTKNGNYVCTEKTNKTKNKNNNNNNNNQSFVTEDGVLMIMIDNDTFYGSDGTIYRSDPTGKIVNSEGKSYEKKIPQPDPDPEPQQQQQQQLLDASEIAKKLLPEAEPKEDTKGKKGSKNKGKDSTKNKKNNKNKGKDTKANDKSNENTPETKKENEVEPEAKKESENAPVNDQNKDDSINDENNKNVKEEENKKDNENENKVENVKEKSLEVEKPNEKDDDKIKTENENQKVEEKKAKNQNQNKKENVKKNAKNKKNKKAKKAKDESDEDEEEKESEKEETEDEKESEKEDDESEKESEKEDDESGKDEEESESEKDDDESGKEDEDDDESEKESHKEEESEEDDKENEIDEDYNETEEGDAEYDEYNESEPKSTKDTNKSKSKKKQNQEETKPKESSKTKNNKSADNSKKKSISNKKNKAKTTTNNENENSNDIGNSTKDIKINNNEEDENSNETEIKNNDENSQENENTEEKDNEEQQKINDNNEEEQQKINDNNEEEQQIINDNNEEEQQKINDNNEEEQVNDEEVNHEEEALQNTEGEEENKENENTNEDAQINENENEESINESNTNENENENDDDDYKESAVGDDENEATTAESNENDDTDHNEIENENEADESNENYNENGIENKAKDETQEKENNDNAEANNENNEEANLNTESGESHTNNDNENQPESTEEATENDTQQSNEEEETKEEDNQNDNSTTEALNKANTTASSNENENDTNPSQNQNQNQNENEDENINADNEDESNININTDNDNEAKTASNIDVFKPGEVYTSHDGNEYEKADDSTFVDKSGKSFKLNEKGDYVAEDGTTMPLSNEQLYYTEPNGSTYRPLPPPESETNDTTTTNNSTNENNESSWINSEGKIFKPTDDSNQKGQENPNKNNNNDDDNDDFVDDVDDESRPFEQKLVADDGTVWNGPNPATGKFGGQKIKKTPVQWVTNDGLVFIPSNKDKSEWTNSEDKKYVKEKESDPEFVRVDEVGGGINQREKWEGPVNGKGHWVSGNGKVIDSDKGIWLSPDKKVYTAVKTGYVQNDNGRLYKPFITSQEATIKTARKSGNDYEENFLVSDDGKDLLKLGEKEGQFISNSGEIYTSVDDDGKEWVDNYGVVYKPHHDGNYFVSDETQQKWQGPPFFNNRKLIDNQFNGFKHDKIKLRYPAAMTLPKRDVVYTNYEVKIGKPRSSTPLYKVPPLKYPPNTHSKYKPFRYRPKTPPGDNGYFYSKFNNQNDNPRRNRLRILNPHAIPPPNIVVDERQVIRLIERGQRQLIPLLRRIASYDPSNVLARNYLKRLDEQKFSQNRYNNDDTDFNNANNSDDDNNDTDVNKKYKGKFNIKFDFDLNTVAPTPISNFQNQKNANADSNAKSIKSPPEKPKTKSARSFVHYNNVLNPMDNNQDYLNLYINRSKGKTKRKNNEDDDRYIEIDNSYSSNGFYQPRKKAPKTDEKSRPFSVHIVSSDKHADSSIISQTTNKPKLVKPQSSRRQKKP